MTPEEFARKVLDAVRELGAFEDAEAVAAFLTAEGIKGERLEPCQCPVARFVAKRIDPDGGNSLFVSVGADNVTAFDWRSGCDDEGGPALKAWVGFPSATQEFIRMFDNYEAFPELVDA